jgi:DNA-binding response OmpR family regulator
MPQIILAVDDDKSILHTLKSVLLKSGYEVITATNGEEALQLLKNTNPDLIISDLIMPMMNGWYFKMKVRHDQRLKTTPIIILSGMVATEGRGDNLEPATYYLPKPFNASALMDKIKELISSRDP